MASPNSNIRIPAAAIIGPPPPSASTSLASLRAYYEDRLARQEAAYQRQLDSYKRQLATATAQKTAAQTSADSLAAQVEALRSSLGTQQAKALTGENAALKSDYAAVLQARLQQGDQIDQLKAENARLTARADAVRRPIARDPLDWLILGVGLVAGALAGLRIGLKRGEDRATGGPIPAHVSAWWSGDARETPTQGGPGN